MSIINLQRGISEAGRIRIGQQVEASNGRTRPAKLDTFRLTSADRRRIDQAAELYGGKVAAWTAPAGKQWEVVTTSDSLDVIVPPSDLSFSQHYELWSAGGCQRRCDGVTEQIGERPCMCDPEARECSIHTRLSVMLRDLPGLGVWRIDTQGYYAAIELQGAVQIIQMAAGRGALLPARLRLEQRSVKRPGKDGKPQTLRFAVPVLDIEITPAQLLSGGAEPLQLEQAVRPPLTPVPAALPIGPQLSIAEQSEPPTPRAKRANAAPEIPASGRQRSSRAAKANEAPTDPPVADGAEHEAAEQPRAESTPAASPRPRRQAKPANEDAAEEPEEPPQQGTEYWMKRVHAAARERGINHGGLRLIAAAVCQVDPAEVNDFSSKDLVIDEFKAIDNVLRSLPESVQGKDAEADIDAVTSAWLWPRAHAKGLGEWDAIDVVAVAATGKQPEVLTLAEWVAFTVRLGLGEYDARQGAA